MQGKNYLEKVHLLGEKGVRCVSYKKPAVSCSSVTAQIDGHFSKQQKIVESAEGCLLSHTAE